VRARLALAALVAAGSFDGVTAARAVSPSAIPPDLTRLVDAWAALPASRLTVQATIVEHVGGRIRRGTASLAVSAAPLRETATTTIEGHTYSTRYLPGVSYVTGPDVRRLVGPGRWLRATDAELAARSNPVERYQRTLIHFVRASLIHARAVRGVGAAAVGGRPTTEFTITLPPRGGTVDLYFAYDGRLVRGVLSTGNEVATVDLSATAPVRVLRPPAAATVSLSDLPRAERGNARTAAASDLFAAASAPLILAGL
jgi:hypothetical protein